MRDDLHFVPVAVQFRRDAGGKLVEPRVQLCARPIGGQRAMIGHEPQQPGHDQLGQQAPRQQRAEADADQRTDPQGQQQRQQQRRHQRQKQWDQHRE